MLIRPRRHRCTAAALLAVLGTACSDAPTTPLLGTLEVSTRTSGGDPDVDGYEFTVDSKRQLVFPNTTARLGGISPGTHAVTLEKVAENCAVTGPNPRSVPVTAGQVVTVEFEVVCVPTGIAVTTRTRGVDMPTAYELVGNDLAPTTVYANDSLTIGRLTPGKYTVRLMTNVDHCRVDGSPQMTVDVSARTVTPVLFEVTCSPAVRAEKIAFVVDSIVGGSVVTWIALVNPDGSGHVNLTPGSTPSWSPDGTRFVFSTTTCEYDDDPFYLPYCTGGLVVLDPEVRTASTLNSGSLGARPAWAPTADAIAFMQRRAPSSLGWRLTVAALDGSPVTPLTILDVRVIDRPAWSPDGTRIAFACKIAPNNWDVCTVDRNGADLVRLTNDDGDELDPSWSPDGKRIAFTRYTSTSEVAIMTLDDRSITRLTTGFLPAWSRDGTKLVFAGGDGLYTIDADGSNRARLTTGRHSAPAWRP